MNPCANGGTCSRDTSNALGEYMCRNVPSKSSVADNFLRGHTRVLYPCCLYFPGFRCDCKDEFTGFQCQEPKRFTACDVLSCNTEHSRCVTKPDNTAECLCDPGYTGTYDAAVGVRRKATLCGWSRGENKKKTKTIKQ